MTIYVVCCVRDSAMDAFMNPWYAPSKGVAIRSFSGEVQNVESPIAQHPSDYELYALGEWNNSTGFLDQYASPVLLARAKDLVVKE